ncbi:unnamed protein product [Musa hybrid cultivar]
MIFFSHLHYYAQIYVLVNTPLEQLDGKYFARGSCSTQQNGAAELMNSKKLVALMVAKLERICGLLKEVIEQTKMHVEKKQALTYEEMEAEREEISVVYYV